MTGPQSVPGTSGGQGVNVTLHQKQPGGAFQAVLDQAVRFSAHAEARLKQRGLPVAEERPALSQAIDALSQAGSKKAAVVTANGTYIVAPQNRTVITALSDGEASGLQMVTNIDAMVVMGLTLTETLHSGMTEGMPNPAAPHWSLIQIPEAGK